MGILAYVTAAAILIGASAAGPMDVPPAQENLLIGGHEALAGVEKLAIAVLVSETLQVDAAKLRALIAAKLDGAGIEHAEGKADACPPLVVRVEGMTAPDCDKCFFRVQTSVNRMVTFLDGPDVRVEAEVWRLRPRMNVTVRAGAGEAITAAVLAQVEAFIDAYRAMRSLPGPVRAREPNTPGSGGPGRAESDVQNPEAATPYPFVASKNSQVFHRPDCRWAQSISDENRLGYRTREDAIRAGKRPCKSCQP